MNQKLLDNAINELPVHVSHPLTRMANSHNYFKKIHLISDVLLGCFRLYGQAMIKITERFNNCTQSKSDSENQLNLAVCHIHHIEQ